MELRLFNTFSREKEVFVPIEPGKVKMYACGVTVYDYVHIGNLRTYIFEDILYRTLLLNGYEVLFVENITDVGHLVGDGSMGEDKIATGAAREGKSVWEIAEMYTRAYWSDMERLNILEPTLWCKATDHIQEQINFIRLLERKGFTYHTSDGIYFDTARLPDYGKLARLNIAGLEEGTRVEKNPERKNITDFALWKFSPPGTKRAMEWESPWGVGFPGWHIECSAMSIKYLGEEFDIHCGGIDHIPVHHTNEIAQNEAAYGHTTVHYWLHGEFLRINEGRMGKSEGNAFTLATLIEKGIDPLSYRYLTYSAHYRQLLNFTWEGLEAAGQAYRNLISRIAVLLGDELEAGDVAVDRRYFERFHAAVNDDLNMPQALAQVWELVKDPAITPEVKLRTIEECDKILGLDLLAKAWALKRAPVPEKVLELVLLRDKAREEKDWKESDRIRLLIEAKGYIVKDTESGQQVVKR